MFRHAPPNLPALFQTFCAQFRHEDEALPRLGAKKVDNRALKDRYARLWGNGRK